MRVESMGGRCRAVIHESHAGLQAAALTAAFPSWLVGFGLFCFCRVLPSGQMFAEIRKELYAIR